MTVLVTTTVKSGHHVGGILTGVSGFFTFLGAAVEASNALDSGRRPSPDVLERLGFSLGCFSDLPV
jgi:hypothetical protein